MRLPRQAVALLAVAATLAACAGGDAPKPADSTATGATAGTVASTAGGTPSGDDDLADVTRYQLTMDKIDKYLAAQRNLGLRMKDMSPGEREAMKARADADDSNDDSMDEMVRKIEAEPALAAAVREAGLSPREYTMLTVSLMQSSMAAGVLKMRPKENQDSLVREMKANPENVKFIQQNEAELQRKQKALAEEMKRLGVPNDG